MTKSELIELLAARNKLLTSKDAFAAVDCILDAISEALARGDRVEVRGFGSFALNHRPSRVGRNPKTGEKVSVPAKFTPHFKAGKEMRELVEAAAQAEAAKKRRVA